MLGVQASRPIAGRTVPRRVARGWTEEQGDEITLVAARGLLDLIYCINSTDVRTIPADQDASKCCDPTAEEYYDYGYGCTIGSTGSKISIAAEFTPAKQAPEETAMYVTYDAIAVEQPIWMVGDSAYDTLDWHDYLRTAGVVPVVPYNERNTDDPLDIEYRVKIASTNTVRTFI